MAFQQQSRVSGDTSTGDLAGPFIGSSLSGYDNAASSSAITAPIPTKSSHRRPPKFELGPMPKSESGSDSKPGSAGLPQEGDEYWAQKTAEETNFTALGIMANTTSHNVISSDEEARTEGFQAVHGLGDGLSSLLLDSITHLGSKDKRYEATPSPVFSIDLEDNQVSLRVDDVTQRQHCDFFDRHEHRILGSKLNATAQEFTPCRPILQGPNLDMYGHMKPTRFEPNQYRGFKAQYRQETGMGSAAMKSFLDAIKLRDEQAQKAQRESVVAPLARVEHASNPAVSCGNTLSSAVSVDPYLDYRHTTLSNESIMKTMTSFPQDPALSSWEQVNTWIQETSEAQAYTHVTAFGDNDDEGLYPSPLNLPRRRKSMQPHARAQFHTPAQYYASQPHQSFNQSGDSLGRKLSSLDSFFLGTSAGGKIVMGTSADGSFCGIPPEKLAEIDRRSSELYRSFPGV